MITIFRFYVPWPIAFLVLLDFLCLALSAYIGISIRNSLNISAFALSDQPLRQSFTPEPNQLLQIATFSLVCLTAIFVWGGYRRPALVRARDALPPLLLAYASAIVILAVIFYVFQYLRIFLLALSPSLIFSLFLVLCNHYAFKTYILHRRWRRKVLVLGTGPAAQKIAQMVEAGYAPLIHNLGFVPSGDGLPSVAEDQMIDCENASLAKFAQDERVDEIIVALEDRRKNLPTTELLKCRLQGIHVINVATFYEREEARVELDSILPSWMIFSTGFSAAKRMQRLAKRLLDIIVSLVGLVVVFPLMAIAAIAIAIEDFGPVFHRQVRVGLRGRHFKLIKLRSMKSNAEEDGVARWSQANDSRVTLVGRILRRTRVDELPQLVNVLRGEMSFVGPRPERPEFVDLLKKEIPFYDYRHTVKPGMTGWAQVNYPYGASVEDAKRKLEYDLYYIKNYSLVLDCIVILQTLRVVVRPEAIEQHPHSLQTTSTYRAPPRVSGSIYEETPETFGPGDNII